MLCPPDASLVRRDPHLPGLALLLDEAAVADLLQAHAPEATVREVRARYLRYKPGVSCLVGYDVTLPGGRLDVYARTHRFSQGGKMAKASQRAAAPGLLGAGIFTIQEPPIAVYVFPNDHELKALRRLGDDGLRRRLLERLLPDRPELWDATLTPLRYKPERRYVGRLDLGGAPRAVVKFFASDDFDRYCRNARWVRSAGCLRVPEVLGRSRKHRVLACRWLDGHPLIPEQPENPARDAVTRVGAALAALHDQEASLPLTYDLRSILMSVHESAAVIGALDPDQGSRAARVAGEIAASLACRRWSPCLIHGDFSADQTLLCGDEVAIVDFDRAGHGDRALDLGSFIGRLEADVIDGKLERHAADQLASGLLDGYEAHDRSGQAAPTPHFAAASLLHLAVEPFRHRHRRWHELLGSYLDRIEELAGRVCAAH